MLYSTVDVNKSFVVCTLTQSDDTACFVLFSYFFFFLFFFSDVKNS